MAVLYIAFLNQSISNAIQAKRVLLSNYGPEMSRSTVTGNAGN